ncbi:hypothetical protein RFI_16396, partial [Reticulomyxa filosa]
KESINDLVNARNFSMDCFDPKNEFIRLELARNYPIQDVSPKKVRGKDKAKAGSEANEESNTQGFYVSPRVGLTLKAPAEGDKSWFDQMMKTKEEYIMAPYRFIRPNVAGQIKKNKPLIGLSAAFADYYKHLHNSTDAAWRDKINDEHIARGAKSANINLNTMQSYVSECQYGIKNSRPVLDLMKKDFKVDGTIKKKTKTKTNHLKCSENITNGFSRKFLNEQIKF